MNLLLALTLLSAPIPDLDKKQFDGTSWEWVLKVPPGGIRCDRIRRITLNKDKTYLEQWRYVEGDPVWYERAGNWDVKERNLILIERLDDHRKLTITMFFHIYQKSTKDKLIAKYESKVETQKGDTRGYDPEQKVALKKIPTPKKPPPPKDQREHPHK